MATCKPASVILPFLTTKAELHNLTTEEETITGQPIEELSFSKNIYVYFTPNLQDDHHFFPVGQVPIGKFKALSAVQVTTNQVLKIDDVYYRVIAAPAAKLKRKILFYTVYMELYKH